jgi:hypothetical protein
VVATRFYPGAQENLFEFLAPRFSRIGVNAPDGLFYVKVKNFRFAELFAFSPFDTIPRLNLCRMRFDSLKDNFTGSLKEKRTLPRVNVNLHFEVCLCYHIILSLSWYWNINPISLLVKIQENSEIS